MFSKILIITFLLALLYACFNTSVTRLVKTLYLIAKVSPYEQVVPDASSILVLGDSTGYGTGASKPEESVAGLIGKDFPEYNIENNSKNGRTIGELVSVVESLEGSYELVLLQIGGNDILQKREVATVESELLKIISELKEHTNNVVMMSTGNVGGASTFSDEDAEMYEDITRNFRKMFLNVSADTGMVYVDLFLEPADDPFIKNPETYLSWDGLHPSSAGYAYWYSRLDPVLAEVLTKK